MRIVYLHDWAIQIKHVVENSDRSQLVSLTEEPIGLQDISSVILKHCSSSESLTGLVRVESAGPDPTVSNSVGLDQDPRFNISGMFSGAADAAV